MKTTFKITVLIISLIFTNCSESNIDNELTTEEKTSSQYKNFLWYEYNPVEIIGKWVVDSVIKDTIPRTFMSKNDPNYTITTYTWESKKIAQILDFKIDTSYIANTYLEAHIRENNYSDKIGEKIIYKYWRIQKISLTLQCLKYEPSDHPYTGNLNSIEPLYIIDYDDNSLIINNFYNGTYNWVIYKKIKKYEIDDLILMDKYKFEELITGSENN